jgi:hypothetical protein
MTLSGLKRMSFGALRWTWQSIKKGLPYVAAFLH